VAPREHDDFTIVRRTGAVPAVGPRAGAFAIVGPGLDPDGIPFPTVELAIARGREIAANSRVSIWDATSTGAPDLIVTFRR
jgi:hypothetical protein